MLAIARYRRILQKGFSLPEVVLVMGIIAILFGFITINFVGITKTTSISATVDGLIADMKSTQEKAMNGAGDGTSGSAFGIYFQSDRYILFRGATYSSSDSYNFAIMLGEGQQLSNITFPASSLVFNQRAG